MYWVYERETTAVCKGLKDKLGSVYISQDLSITLQNYNYPLPPLLEPVLSLTNYKR